MAATFAYAEPLRVLCTREFQVSIKESFHAELKAAIASEPWLDAFYDVGADYLRGANGTEFLFRGLRHNTANIKSLAKIDLTIVEEAEEVPELSWTTLEPTVLRQPKSEIWVIWNPRDEDSPVDKRFRKTPPPGSLITEINYQDNPWFPENLELLRKREQERLDVNTYAHIWDGAYLENSETQVLSGKWCVKEFTPGKDWDGPYHGLDFGFSQDPLAATKSWIHHDCLYVEYETGGIGIELDDTPSKLKRDIDGIQRFEILADNSRPESIRYLNRHGLPRCRAAKKWSGSVEDGISYLRSYKQIIIHPRCRETAKEARLYSYKVDAKSGQVLDTIVDANNHYIDSLRYGHDKIIRAKNYNLRKLING